MKQLHWESWWTLSLFDVQQLLDGHVLYGMMFWPLVDLVDEEEGGAHLAYPAGTQAGGVPDHLEQRS